jgi:hypothetical protein
MIMTKVEDKAAPKPVVAAAPPVAKSLLATKAKSQDDFDKYA